jgi:hypothetical protein
MPVTNLTAKEQIAIFNHLSPAARKLLLGTRLAAIISELDSSPEYDITTGLDLSSGDVTLTATQAATGILEVTTGHASNAIIAPVTSGKVFIVMNNDASNEVLIKDVGGSAVTIPAGKNAAVAHNGTDFEKYATNEVTQDADLIINTNKFKVTASTGDVTQTNTQDDATGVTTTVTKSRATGTTCTDNDVIEEVQSVGYNDNATPAAKTVAVAQTLITDATDTSEAGAFVWKTMQAGTAAAEVLRVDTGVTATGTGGAQITAKYDAAAYTTITQADAGGVTYDCTSDGVAKHTFSDPVEVSGEFINTNVAEVFDDFLYQTITEADTPWILNSGADPQALDPAISAQAGGVIRATTGDADGTTANDGSQLVCHIPLQAQSGGTFFETRLHINTAITDVSVFAGLTDSTALEEAFTNSADVITSTASDAAGFLYDTDATTDEWWTLAVDSDTDDAGNAASGTAPVADTYQTLRMEISADGATIIFYIDGTAVATLTGDAGVSPDVNLYATVIACATTTTSKTVDIDYVKVGTTR